MNDFTFCDPENNGIYIYVCIIKILIYRLLVKFPNTYKHFNQKEFLVLKHSLQAYKIYKRNKTQKQKAKHNKSI